MPLACINVEMTTEPHDDELAALRTIGANWLAASVELVGQAIEDGDLKEIEHDDDET